jgi:putative ABC transport system ATP-binding protein
VFWKKPARTKPGSPKNNESQPAIIAETLFSLVSEMPQPHPGDLPIIDVQEIKKVYRSAAGDFSALKGISAQIFPGEFIGIIGKSGAGKSTLLNMITGVDDASLGEVIVNTHGKTISVHRLSENELAVWRGQNVGIVYQSFQLLPMLTLLENVMLPIDLCGNFQPRASRERAAHLLEMVELSDHAHKLPAYISGGQQQRVAIARALANDPQIIIADEPTGSLDSVTADVIFQLFEQLVQGGKTIVMVTHDNTLGPRFSRRLYLADGELVL